MLIDVTVEHRITEVGILLQSVEQNYSVILHTVILACSPFPSNYRSHRHARDIKINIGVCACSKHNSSRNRSLILGELLVSAVLVEAYTMAIKFHSIDVNLLIISILATPRINAVAASINNDLYFGPYLDIYPPVDLSQNQFDCIPQSAGNRTCPLYIALTMSFGGEYFSSGVVPGVQYALDQINANPDLLPGYSLHYTLTDSQVQLNARQNLATYAIYATIEYDATLAHSIIIFCLIQCNRTVSLRALHTQLFNPPTKIAAMGSGCSIATEASAEVSHFYNITQVGDDKYNMTLYTNQ